MKEGRYFRSVFCVNLVTDYGMLYSLHTVVHSVSPVNLLSTIRASVRAGESRHPISAEIFTPFPLKHIHCWPDGGPSLRGGLDQYPSMGRFRKRPFVAMGGIPGPPGGETKERPLILCGLKHGMRLAHTKKDENRGHVHTCRKARAN